MAAAGFAHAQAPSRFAFASQAQAVLGERDAYIRATAPFERLAWTEDEQRELAGLLSRLESFIATMRWKAPSSILLVKASDKLLEGLLHTRGIAIILQQGMLRHAMRHPDMLAYLLSHETFHVLSRSDTALREELYSAIGFKACSAVDMPAPLANLRVTNPDAPENRHTIVVRRGEATLEILPLVHFRSGAVDPRAGFPRQTTTSWLPVEREQGRCKVRDERVQLDLEAIFEKVGRNTNYTIHPEEILADNFALLFQRPRTVASPEVLERIEKILGR